MIDAKDIPDDLFADLRAQYQPKPEPPTDTPEVPSNLFDDLRERFARPAQQAAGAQPRRKLDPFRGVFERAAIKSELSVPQQLAVSAADAFAGLKKSAGGLLQSPVGSALLMGSSVERPGGQPLLTSDELEKSGRAIADEAELQIKKNTEVTKALGVPYQAASPIASGAASMLPSLVAARFGGFPASVGMAGLQSFGSTYDDAVRKYREDFKLPDDEAKDKALRAATLAGLITAGATAIFGGAEKFVAGLGSGAIKLESAKQLIKGAITKAAPMEGLEESVDQALQGIAARASFDPKKTWKQIRDETLIAGALGTVLGGGAGLAFGGAQLALQGEQDVDQETQQEQVPSGQQEGPQPGDVQEPIGGEEQAPGSGVLQAPEEEVTPAPGAPVAREAAFAGYMSGEGITPTPLFNIPGPAGRTRTVSEATASREGFVIPVEQIPSFSEWQSASQPAVAATPPTPTGQSLTRQQLLSELRGRGVRTAGGRRLQNASNEALRTELAAQSRPVGQQPRPTQPARPAPVARVVQERPPQEVVKPERLRELIQQRSRSRPVAPPVAPTPPRAEALARLIQQRSRSRPSPPPAQESQPRIIQPGQAATPEERAGFQAGITQAVNNLRSALRPTAQAPPPAPITTALTPGEQAAAQAQLEAEVPAAAPASLTPEGVAPVPSSAGPSGLSPQNQADIDIAIDDAREFTERAGVRGVQIVEDPATEANRPVNPNAVGTISNDGRILLSRARLEGVLARLSPRARRRFVRALVGEEALHTVIEQNIAKEKIEAVWRSLNQQEQQELLDSYAGGQRGDLTDYQLGQEYLRQLLQVKFFGTRTESTLPGSTLFSRVKDQVNQVLFDLVRAFRRIIGRSNTEVDGVIDRIDEALKAGPSGVFAIKDVEAPASLGQAKDLLVRERAEGTPESIANAEQNIIREQAAEVTGHNPAAQENIAQLQLILEQRNRRGDMRLRGEALERMRVIDRVFNNPIIQQFFVRPLIQLQESANLMGAATTTFSELNADPNAPPQLKSAAAGAALKQIDAFLGRVFSFRSSYDTTRKQKLQELQTALSGGNAAQLKVDALDALRNDFGVIARTMVTVEKDASLLQGLRRAMGNRSAVKNVLEFIATHVDLTPVGTTITTTDQMVEHIKAAASGMITPTTSFEQVLGSNAETIQTVAQFIVRSQAIRSRIADSSAFLSSTAAAPRAPKLDKFKAAVAKQVADGNIGAALRLFITGVGRTAVERGKIKAEAQHFLSKAQQILIDLEAMQQVRAFIDGVEQSPDFRATVNEVFGQLGVEEQIRSLDGTTWRMAPLYSGDTPTILQGGPDGGATDLEALNEWAQRAMKYAADVNHPEYNPAKAAAIRAWLANQGVELDPSINPGAARIIEGEPRKGVRNIFGYLLDGLADLPKFVLQLAAGLEAEIATRAMNAYNTVQELKTTLFKTFSAEFDQALKKAIKSHGLNTQDYNDLIFTPLAASLQSFNNPRRLKVGSKVGNGHTITKEDIEFYEVNRRFERAVIDATNAQGDRAFQAIKASPRGILYRSKASGKLTWRRPYETGPGTLHRRLTSMRTFAAEWRAAGTIDAKIKILNRNLERILMGHVRDVNNPDFAFRYQFADEFKAIAADVDNPVTSFQDLVDRVFELHIESAEEPMSPDQIAAQIVGEVNQSVSRWERFNRAGQPGGKSILQAWGGENSFNTERGQQIVPSTWYDYGSTDRGQFLGFLHNSTVGFAVELHNALEALEGSLATKVNSLATEERKGANVETQQRELAEQGKTFYTWGQLKVVRNAVSKLRSNLEKSFLAQHDRPLIGTREDVFSPLWFYSIASMLASPITQTMNAIGGIQQMILLDANLRSQSALLTTARFGGRVAKRVYHEALNLLAHDGTPAGRAVYKALSDAKAAPIIGKLFEVLTEHIESTRKLYGDAKRLGISQNIDLWRTFLTHWTWWKSGGIPSGQEARTLAGKAANLAATGLRAFSEVLKQMSVGFVDARLNVMAFEMAHDWEQDFMRRAIKFGEVREERARAEGRDPFDTTDIRNRFSDLELVGGRLKPVGPSATRLREFMRRDAGINLDYAMQDFYKRWREAGSPDPDKLPGTLFLNQEQWNQLVLALSKNFNQATFDTRPIGIRVSKTFQALSLFQGYAGWANYQLASWADRESRKPTSQAVAENLPMLIGTVMTMTLLGSMGQWATDELRKLILKRQSPFPTVFDDQTPSSRVKSVLTAFASTLPFYGSIINSTTGRTYRRGYDVNSMFVPLNQAQDVMGTTKEIFQSGDFTVPMLRFLSRWFSPFNMVGPRLKPISGLNEVSQVRNLLVKGAAQTDLEVERPKTYSAIDKEFSSTTGELNAFMNAIGNRDEKEAVEAYYALVKANSDAGKDKPEEAALRAIQSRHPVSLAFRSRLTEEEFSRLLGVLPEDEAKKIRDFIEFENSVLVSVGGRPINPTKEPQRMIVGGAPARSEFDRSSRDLFSRGSSGNRRSSSDIFRR